MATDNLLEKDGFYESPNMMVKPAPMMPPVSSVAANFDVYDLAISQQIELARLNVQEHTDPSLSQTIFDLQEQHMDELQQILLVHETTQGEIDKIIDEYGKSEQVSLAEETVISDVAQSKMDILEAAQNHLSFIETNMFDDSDAKFMNNYADAIRQVASAKDSMIPRDENGEYIISPENEQDITDIRSMLDHANDLDSSIQKRIEAGEIPDNRAEIEIVKNPSMPMSDMLKPIINDRPDLETIGRTPVSVATNPELEAPSMPTPPAVTEIDTPNIDWPDVGTSEFDEIVIADLSSEELESLKAHLEEQQTELEEQRAETLTTQSILPEDNQFSVEAKGGMSVNLGQKNLMSSDFNTAQRGVVTQVAPPSTDIDYAANSPDMTGPGMG